ncbi:MAG: hypothetical protein JRJ51_07275 [Deltaproteobacteria bacterium]|nr:hypothetical protein [Deltaproteobacteria bacterium]
MKVKTALQAAKLKWDVKRGKKTWGRQPEAGHRVDVPMAATLRMKVTRAATGEVEIIDVPAGIGYNTDHG